MSTLTLKADERVEAVYFSRDSLVVDLMDGRTISAPLTWYPKLLKASLKQRSHFEICGGGYGIHWPDLDEDLSTQGLLRGSPAPKTPQRKTTKKPHRPQNQKTRPKQLQHRYLTKNLCIFPLALFCYWLGTSGLNKKNFLI